MHWFSHRSVSPPDSAPAGFWDWVSGTLSVSDIIQGSGLALIVVLFATGGSWTIGDHRGRIEDSRVPRAVLREKDARYAEMKESGTSGRRRTTSSRSAPTRPRRGPVRELGVEYAQISNHLMAPSSKPLR